MSQKRSQTTKSPSKKQDSFYDSSEPNQNEQYNQDEDQKKYQKSVITISALSQKLLNYSNKNSFDKYFRTNLVRVSEKLILKRSFPKYVVENCIPFLKMLNQSASLFMEMQDFNSTMQVLDLALRLTTVIKNEIQADVQQFVTINNLSVLSSKLGKQTLSKSYLKNILEKIEKNYKESKPDSIETIEAITLNNLCSIYIQEQKYEKVYQYSENALILVENKIFKRIKEEGEITLKKNSQFLNDLQILLQGYIYRGWSQDEIKNQMFLEYIQKNDQSEDSFSDKQKIYNNGYRLSSIILGKESKMAKIFQSLIKQTKQEQSKIQKKIFQGKDAKNEEEGIIKYYQNRLEKVLDIQSQEYLDSEIDQRLFILKYTFSKSENLSFSEQNNVTIIDTQEDHAEEQEIPTMNIEKNQYKINSVQSQPQSPMSNKTQRNDSKSFLHKKLIFRNQAPNLQLNQNIKAKRLNNLNYINNGNHGLSSGIKERAQSYHGGVNSYFLNSTVQNQNRGGYDGISNEANQKVMNYTNLSQNHQLPVNNNQQGFLVDGNIEQGLPNGMEYQGLSRHQQLQQQMILAGNGNGMLYNKRFNNSQNNLYNPNYINNITDNQINNHNQQHDYSQQQINPMNLYQQYQQLNHQASLGTPQQNQNQHGPINRFTQFINGIASATSTPQQILPQIQSGMTPNQILHAQMQQLGGIKHPIISNTGILSQGQLPIVQGTNQLNALKNIGFLQGNNLNNNNNINEIQQLQQLIQQNEINKLNLQTDLQKIQHQISAPSRLDQQNGQTNNFLQITTNGKQNVNENKDEIMSNNEKIQKTIIQTHSQHQRRDSNYANSQLYKVQDSNESHQSNNYFVLNKDYNVPESAAFPSVYTPAEFPNNSQIQQSIKNNEIHSSQNKAVYSESNEAYLNQRQEQDLIRFNTKQTGTFSQDQSGIRSASPGTQQTPSTQANSNNISNNQIQFHNYPQLKYEKADSNSDSVGINIPLSQIEKKGEQLQNGDIPKNINQIQVTNIQQQQQQTQISNLHKLQQNDKQADNSQKKDEDKKLTNDQKRQNYKEQITKEIVSLKNIPTGCLGTSNAESQTIEKNNGNGMQVIKPNNSNPTQNSKDSPKQSNDYIVKYKEQDILKDEVIQNQQTNYKYNENVKISENMKLSESTAYPQISTQIHNQNGISTLNNNYIQQYAQNNLISPNVTPTNKGINPTILNSPNQFINNGVMVQVQQYQVSQNQRLKHQLMKEENSNNKIPSSPQSIASQNYSNLYKYPINTNVNGIQGGGGLGSGNQNSTNSIIGNNGQSYFIYPQSNNQNISINSKTNSYQSTNQYQKPSSKQRIPSINAMLQNGSNSQNAINQNPMVQSDISLNRNEKLSQVDIYTTMGTLKQNQWAIFNDCETDYLRHITIEYLSTVNYTVQKILQYNSVQYLVEVGINKNSLELTFELSGYQIQDKTPLQTENITLSVMKGIFNILDLSEGTPFNKPFKTIQGFKDLCQYLIFPFIQINESARKIEINKNIISIIQYPQWSIEFLKQNCNATFNHLNNNEFKLTLKSNDKDFMRIDLCFDEITMKSQFQTLECPLDKNFERIENYERYEIKNIVEIIDQFDEEEINVNKKEKIQELNQKILEIKKPCKISLPGFQVPNTIIFLQKLQDLLNLVSQFLLKTHNYSTVKDYIDDQCFKVLRINVNDDFKKGQITFIKETKAFQTKSVIVSIQNIHETHAPYNKLVQCVGKKEIAVQDFWKTFGIEYEKFDKEEKYYFFTLLGLKYNLYTHTKPLDEDDYGRYQENPIIMNNTSIGGYSRTLKVLKPNQFLFIKKENQYKYPLTCQLIGFEDIAYGVKVTLHNQEQNSEHGVFFIIDPINWVKFKKVEDPNTKKKRTKKYKDEFDIIKNYEVANVLASAGYKLIENSLCFRKIENQPVIAGRNLYSGFISNIDKLENVVCIDEVMKYLISAISQ